NSFAHDQTIDHGLNRVPLILFQAHRLRTIELDDFAIDPSADETFALQSLDYVAKFAGLLRYQRCKHHDLGVRLVSEDLIDNLLRCLTVDRFPGLGIVRLADGRKQNAQVIVNFCRRGDGRARIRAGAALLNRDRGRKTFDEIDVWLFHLIKKLPGISGEALDVTPLSFSIYSGE